MDQKITDLHDAYRHGLLDRREFLKKVAVVAGSAAAAEALIPLLERNYAEAETVPNNPNLDSGYINYSGDNGEIKAAFSRSKGDTKLPGVIVVHENRGLNAHIEDVSRRIASEGFYSIAPDALSPLGGTPENSQEAAKMIGQLNAQATTKNYLAAVKYLKTHPSSTGKVGVVGFCWGGAMANQIAVNSPDVSAVVSYYGRQPASEDVPKIKASLLLHYAGLDEGINKGIPAYEDALKKAAVDYRIYMYQGAYHAFNNDTNAERYNKEAAQLAWQRTIMFLKEKLKT